MTTFSSFRKSIILILIFLFSSHLMKAQFNSDSTTRQELFNEIATMDSLLFNVAFNKCNFDLFDSIINEDLEFYDDRTGLNVLREKELESFKDRCGTNNISKVKRKLVSMEVYPLNHYGAVQIGIHGFYMNGNTEDELVEIAKFIHVWQNVNEKWKVTRVISYDHKAL